MAAPSWKPELSINNLYTSSDDEDDIEDEVIFNEQKKKETELNLGNKTFEEEGNTFEIYDTDSLANGIFNLEQIRDSNGNKIHLKSYSNNLLLSKQWEKSSILNQKEIFNSLKYYQWATSVIEKHIGNENSVLCFLKCSFMKLFSDRYKEKLQNLKGRKLTLKEFEDLHSDANHELMQFIRVLQELLSLYYDLEDIGKKFSKFCLFTKDNLKNFTTSLVLNDEFYYLIFALHKRMYRSHAKKFRKNFTIFEKYDPSKFGVNPALCLDQNTLEYFKEKQIEINLNDKNYKNEENNSYFRSFAGVVEEYVNKTKEISEELRTKSEISLEESKYLSNKIKNHVKFQISKEELLRDYFETYIDMSQNEPYKMAIQTFKNIIFYKSPIHKLKIILKTLEKIEKSIQKFYDKFRISYSKELAGDEIVPIFLYVVSKSNIPNLYAHLKFIDNFATSNVLNSKAGYYNATLQICVSHLEDFEKGNENASEEIKDSLFTESIRSCIEEINRRDNKKMFKN